MLVTLQSENLNSGLSFPERLPYSQAVVQGVRHTQLIIRDNNIVK